MNNECPHCGSGDTQKVSVIFESGTSVIDTKASHVAFAAGQTGTTPIVGGTRQQGTQQTGLAARLAPPVRGTPIRTVLGALVLGPVVAGIVTFGYGLARQVAEVEGNAFAHGEIVFWSVYGLLVLLAIGASTEMHKFNRDQYPGLLAEWNAKWLCHRCGEPFVPEGQAAAVIELGDHTGLQMTTR